VSGKKFLGRDFMAQSNSVHVPDAKRCGAPLLFVALGGWLLVLPATLLLGAAALRLLQPAQVEPAHTFWIILDWVHTHITRLHAALIFIVLPAAALMAGSALLLCEWRNNDALRQDVAGMLAILKRQMGSLLLAADVTVAAGILALVIDHLIAG
jgi:hypothetical protein